MRIASYDEGLDVLGAGLGIGDFVPWLNVVGKVAGGIASVATGDSGKGAAQAPQTQAFQQKETQDAIRRALEKERERQAAEKARADAAATRNLVYVLLGVVGVGGALLILKK